MRVYCYCPETGVYQGEDFMEECLLDVAEGVTRIAPPIHPRGQAPVYDASRQCWNLVEFPGRRTAPPMKGS